MPGSAAIAVCLPMRALWPIWHRLSIFVPSPIDVTPVCARSMHVFAPISTSSPSSTLPICGIFTSRPSRNAQPKPSLPITAPACSTTRSPAVQRSARYARGWNRQSGADRRLGADRRPRRAARCGRRRARAGRRATCGPIQTSSPTCAVGSTAAVGWTNGPAGRGGSSAASSAASATRADGTASTGLGYDCAAVEQRFVGEHRGRARLERRAQIALVDRKGQRRCGRRRRPRRSARSTTSGSPTTRPPTRAASSAERPERRPAKRIRRTANPSRRRARLLLDLEDLLDVRRDVDARRIRRTGA